MNRLQKELEHERQRNIVLYQAFLPKDAVDYVYSDSLPVGGTVGMILLLLLLLLLNMLLAYDKL